MKYAKTHLQPLASGKVFATATPEHIVRGPLIPSPDLVDYQQNEKGTETNKVGDLASYG